MANAWTEKEAGHLLRRAAFSATRREVEAAVALGREETVSRLVGGQSLTGEKENLASFTELKADGKALAEDQIGDHQTYWLYRMAYTQAPLIEKMTLFWHGHFATSYQKVREIPLMIRQNELLRKNALGSFKELVRQIGKDPAMMLWLDSGSNRKGKPNENYAREVMELFTLGIGSYSEQDVKEAARAFTGWNYDKKEDKVSFLDKQHDMGKKTLLGETGSWNESDAVDILFKQEALSRFMAGKLLQYFGSYAPSGEWLAKVANDFRTEQTVGEVLRGIFTSDEFYDDTVQLALVKTPSEYAAGIIRILRLPMSRGYASALRKMGQELYLPPNVSGWKEGQGWLVSSWLLARYQFAESIAQKSNSSLLSTKDFLPSAAGANGGDWVDQWTKEFGFAPVGGTTREVLAKYAEDSFVYSPQKNAGKRGLLQLLLISPEAQMK